METIHIHQFLEIGYSFSTIKKILKVINIQYFVSISQLKKNQQIREIITRTRKHKVNDFETRF